MIGDGNRFAHAAALAVAELPGQAYNPLFIYGPPGVGKTHLLHAIGNYVQRYGDGLTRPLHDGRGVHQPSSSPRCTAATSTRFKGGYRDADVLLIDDVQFLESKAKTEEEFFHTFNALLRRRRASSCSPPTALPRDLAAPRGPPARALRGRPRRRLEPPDLATRLAILRKRAQHDGVDDRRRRRPRP